MPYFADKYVAVRVLGRGGMGTVFEARHARLGHRVAIKVLGEELRQHPELVKRFEREARAAGALSSSRAVKIFDIDQTSDGTPFMVMELLEGRDLANLVEEDGPQPIGVSVRFIVEASDAIAEAHRLGIIHRDIKPSNLFLCADTGSVKVLDFGIAKRVESKEAAITLGAAPLGTPQYMSPEQVRCAEDIDARSDIWSLGVTLYELLCGRPPYNHDVAQACIAAIVVDPIPDPRAFRPEIPEGLVSVLMRALEKEPEKRFGSIDAMVEALRPFADEGSPCEDESWRTRSAMRLARAKQRTTLGSGNGSVDLDFGRHRHHEELTVPPAVSPTENERRGRRLRSSLTLATATLLGLGTLIVLPRVVGVHLEETAAGAPVTSAVVMKAAAAPVISAEIAPPSAPENETSTLAAIDPVEAVTFSVVTNAASAASAASAATTAAVKPPRPVIVSKPSVPKARPPARSSTAAPAGAGPAVHGGLSSPGF